MVKKSQKLVIVVCERPVCEAQQVGIGLKTNLRVCFGQYYVGLKLEYYVILGFLTPKLIATGVRAEDC